MESIIAEKRREVEERGDKNKRTYSQNLLSIAFPHEIG
jgi:hypothetical protein